MRIADMLAALNLEEMEATAYKDIRSGKKTSRLRGVKMLRVIDGLKRADVGPADLMIDRVPIIPAQFRPYTKAGDTFIPGDANELYADLIRGRRVQDQTEAVLGRDVDADRYVRTAVRAAYGYGDSPNPKLRARKVSGMMSKILGGGPKTSFVQSKLLSKPQDFVGRGVIEPDPDLGMDEVGISEDMAWEIYSPFIRRRLIARGIPASRALKLEKDRDPSAKAALEAEMGERPVMTSRSPAWHHHGFVSLWPKLRKGKVIYINPYITAGAGADFDGDSGRFWLTIMRAESKNKDMAHNNLETRHACGTVIRIEDMPHIASSALRKSNTTVEYDVPAGISVLAYNVESGEQGYYPVTKFSIHEGLTLHSVNAGKDSFLASDDHSLLAFSRQTNKVEKITPLQAVTGKSAQNLHAPCSLKGFTEESRKETIQGPSGGVPALYSLGFALGVYAGDGCFVKSRERVTALYLYGGGASSSKRKIATHYSAARTFQNLFGCLSEDPRYDEYARESLGGKIGKSGRTTLNAGTDQAAMLRGYGWLRDICGAGAEGKRLPSDMLDYQWEFRWGLFCGVMASDGTIVMTEGKEKPQLAFGLNSVVSLQLASDFMALASSLGLRAGLTEAKRKTSTGKPEYTVSISTSDLSVLWERKRPTIGCNVRQELLDKVLPGIRVENTPDSIPFPGGSLAFALKEASWSLSGKPMKGTKRNFGAARSWDSNGYWHRATFAQEWERLSAWVEEHRGELSEEVKHYKTLMSNPEICWRPLEISEETITAVGYDITVPEVWTFATAAGTFVQDTMSLHIPVTEEALKDAKEKLLPSQLLFSVRNRDKTHASPKHEQLLGLSAPQLNPSGITHNFSTRADAMSAYGRGEVNLRDSVEIADAPPALPPPMI